MTVGSFMGYGNTRASLSIKSTIESSLTSFVVDRPEGRLPTVRCAQPAA